MSVSLKKGSSLGIEETALSQGMRIGNAYNMFVGLGWDCNRAGGENFDLDAWALCIPRTGNVTKKGLVYFGHTADASGNIKHMGDNLTGRGEGDDEVIRINVQSNLSDLYKYILVGVTIYKAASRRQAFKDVNNTFIRVCIDEGNHNPKEICKYADVFKGELGLYSTMLFGVFYFDGCWKFKAIGSGSKARSISTDVINVYGSFSLDDYINMNIKENEHMAVSLAKGGKVSLAKVAADAGIASLTKILVGLGWDVNRYDGGQDFDLDASAFMVGANGKVRNEKDFIFYSNLTGPGIQHMGDERTGGAEGDDEQIKIDLSQIPADIEKIAFAVTIYDAVARNQSFGQVENSYIHIVDEASGTELIRYDLGEDFSVENTLVVAELYRHNGEWKFNAIGSGFEGGLKALCGNYGVDVE